MSAGRRLSVIVPAHNAEGHLQASLDALAASELDRSEWELIVVDDASTDTTPAVARSMADKVIATGAAARGPAYARNRGAREATSGVLAFIDADVAVHPDALTKMLRRIDEDPARVAVFGSYDDDPADRGFISRYRNLLHHFAHNEAAGNVATFWAGCGAVRAEAFFKAGGFDENRYAKPQIEDIELGYRLSGLGPILLDPSIQGTHFKRWHMLPMLRTDMFDRGIPWVRLLLRGDPAPAGANPSLGMRALLGTAAVCAALAALIVAMAGGGKPFFLASGGLVAASVALNAGFYRFLAARGGLPLALAGIPLHLVYQIISGFSVPAGAILYFTRDKA